jgi:hypothetical protein
MSHPIEYLPVASPATEEVLDASRAYADFVTATESLHAYPGTVIGRESMGTATELPYATIHEEKLLFADGAVRTLTRVAPRDSYFGAEQCNPYIVSAGDALCTGPTGFNANVIDQLARRGFAVAWLHHQGRHTELPTNLPKAMQFARFILKKSVGRSAHHQHSMLDDLALNSDHDTSTVISIGDSRSSMTGEAVDALASQYDRSIIYSDYNASCFEHRPKVRELPKLAASLPLEGLALARLARRMQQDPSIDVAKFLGTFDMHPLNLLHETAWLVPLIRGDAGRYGDAVPLDQNGVRTHLNGDTWSSGGTAWESKYLIRPNIHLIKRGLTNGRKARHFDLADPEIQEDRYDRLERVTEEVLRGNDTTETLDMRFVVKGIRSVTPRAA